MERPVDRIPELRKILERSRKAGHPLPEDILYDWRALNEDWLRIQRYFPEGDEEGEERE